MAPKPAPPSGCGPTGKRLWSQVLARYELDQHELALLREAVRTADTLDQLAGIVARDGAIVDGKIHPALVEQRQMRVVLARLIASLRLPEGEHDDRPQRRGSARGAYLPRRRLRGVS